LTAFNTSLGQSFGTFAFKDISQYFINGFDDLLNNPATRHVILRDGIMGYHGVPQMPLFAYKAIGDLISPIADTDDLVEKYCNMGVNILYHRNTIGGHSAESVNGLPAAEAWLNAALNGTLASAYASQGCINNTVSVNITSTALRKRGLVGNLIEDS
jgi:hypothetical protein